MTARTSIALVATVALVALGCSSKAPRDGNPQAAADREYADAMAREHAEDAPVPSEMARVESVAPITTETVAYGTVAGEPVSGFLAHPTGDAADGPGIVLIHEWWGLNDNIRNMARELAGLGYQALAVDLYGGRSAETPEEARSLVESVMASPELAGQNLGAALAFLRGHGAARIGVIGWCFGGGWSLQTGLDAPELVDAVVVYYGRVVTDRDQLQQLDAPLLGIFGAEDQGIPVDSVRAMEAQLRELGKDATIRIYEGAGHAFANPSGRNYAAEPAEDAWKRTLDFFARHLKGEPAAAEPGPEGGVG